jgi:hypothetical protein
MAHRIGRLSADAAYVLDVAAVLGRSFWVGDVADGMGESVGQIQPRLDEAVKAGVLASTSDAFDFRHISARDVIYQQILPAVRLALHRRIGGVLLDRGGSAIPAADHLIHGARRGDHQALAGLDQATHELLPSSPAAAADLALRALQLTRPADEDRFVRTATAVDALVAARRTGEASDLARAILTRIGLPAPLRGRLRLTLSSVSFWNGSFRRPRLRRRPSWLSPICPSRSTRPPSWPSPGPDRAARCAEGQRDGGDDTGERHVVPGRSHPRRGGDRFGFDRMG